VEGDRNARQGPNEIADRICEATGLGYRTVIEYLDPSFKQQSFRRTDPSQHHSQKDPEEIIFNRLKLGDPTWARTVIERFKQEHEKQLLESPLFRKKILDSIPRSIQQPMRPAIAFDPQKDEQVQELLRLKEEDVFPNGFPNGFFRSMTASRERKARKQEEAWKGTPLGSLYEDFIQDCPNCLCSKCPHSEVCIERVRPED
jgi:hypothetical protein